MILKLGKPVLHVSFTIQSVFSVCQSFDFVASNSSCTLHAHYKILNQNVTQPMTFADKKALIDFKMYYEMECQNI
jgi:hypothetical protein